MGHKTNPIGIRLGITADWQSRWFANPKLFKTQLRSDVEMHDFIMKKWKQAAIASVQIERSAATIRVIIETSRPGVLIGRGGTGIEDLARVVKNHFFRGKKTDLKVEVKEIKRFEESASLIGQQIAEQLEKRIPFRRALKGMIDQVTQNKDILGVKVEISGRLGGAEMRILISRGWRRIRPTESSVSRFGYTRERNLKNNPPNRKYVYANNASKSQASKGPARRVVGKSGDSWHESELRELRSEDARRRADFRTPDRGGPPGHDPIDTARWKGVDSYFPG